MEFIVIGGQAEALYGSARVTYDVDLCYLRTEENLERLAKALHRMNPTLRNAPPDLPFVLDKRALMLGDNFTFNTDHGALDMLGYLEPIGGFKELAMNAEEIEGDEISFKVIALEDLITIKRHLGRPKDQESLRQLLAIKRLREEEEAG